MAVPIHNAEALPECGKVVLDAEGYALYFSRATITGSRSLCKKSGNGEGYCLRHRHLWLSRGYHAVRELATQPAGTY